MLGSSAMALAGAAGYRLPADRDPAAVVNVRVSVDAFAAHIEPAIAVNPRDPENLLIASRVFQDGRIGMASYASRDGGAHWTSHGLLPGLTPDFDGNPAVAFDRNGTGYVCGIVATTDLPRHGDALLWRTLDGGGEPQPPVVAINGGAGLVDHCSIAADPHPSSPVPLLYATAVLAGTDRDGLVFTRSADGGRTFAAPVYPAPSTGALAPVLAAARGGTVCLVYLAPTAGAAVLNTVTSTDHGETFAAPVPLAAIARQAPDFGDVLSAKSGPAVAADSESGSLYAVVTSWDDAAARSRILLWASADRGRTWTGPTAVADSTREVYLQPQVAAFDDNVAVSCYVVDPVARRLDVRIHLSRRGRPDTARVRRVTSQSFDPTLAPGSPPWLGNYQGLTAAPGGFHPVWTDTRTGAAQLFTATIDCSW